MKKKLNYNIGNFIIFFLMVSFVVTCNFFLFLDIIDFNHERLLRAAIATFVNVIWISFLFTMFDAHRRKSTVTKPVRMIQTALDKVINGDFSTRIPYLYGPDSNNEFDQIITSLNKMIEELSGVETLRTDFIANVSHELKTPLAVMQNYGTLLQSEDLSDEQRKEYGRAISEQTRRLSNLVMNILKLNKLENQQIYPNVEKYDLGEQVCECMLEFEAVWENKEIELEVDLEEEVIVEADKELLSLVWNNLLSNALKFTPEKGTVGLKLYTEESWACVQVSDTGCGMTPETGKNIFKKFYQGDTSHATKGNGLGLALVKRVIDICGAEISVSSRLGEGSTFTVKLRRELNE